jgi:DNA gyrase inhibitor GyrI
MEETKMKIIEEIKLVTLSDMRVISFHGFGKSPEDIAWHNLRTWLQENGYQAMVKTQRFFGFNHPNPSPGSDNYGYEQWMTLPVDYSPREGEIIKTLAGGLYAVGGFRDATPQAFGRAWQAVNDWRVDSEYIYDESRQWLEELLTTESVLEELQSLDFDCLMPVIQLAG